MSALFETIKDLILLRNVKVSTHAFHRCSKRDLSLVEIVRGTATGEVIEQYPNHHTGPSLLVSMFDETGPVHAVWGLERGSAEPAVLVTAYRPSLELWDDEFRTRRK